MNTKLIVLENLDKASPQIRPHGASIGARSEWREKIQEINNLTNNNRLEFQSSFS